MKDEIDCIETLFLDISSRDPRDRDTIEDMWAFFDNRVPWLIDELKKVREKRVKVVLDTMEDVP